MLHPGDLHVGFQLLELGLFDLDQEGVDAAGLVVEELAAGEEEVGA